DVGLRLSRRGEGDIDGKALARENLRGQAGRFEPEIRLGTAAERERVDRDAKLSRLPGRAHDAAQIFIPIGDESEAGDETGREGSAAIAQRGFEIRTA